MNSITAILAVIIVMFSLLSSTADGEQKQGSRAEDEAAIRKNIFQLQDGWNAGDGAGFAAPFAEDADYVVVNGMYIKGRTVIADGHQHIFDTIYKNSYLAAAIQSVRFLRDDVAIVHVKWHLKIKQGDATHDTHSMNTLVMTKEDQKWSITAFHNTPIADEQR